MHNSRPFTACSIRVTPCNQRNPRSSLIRKNRFQVTVSSPFPSDFLWGVATSAYQVEGSTLADGGGPNIWHRFSREPGMTVEGATGDVACDHYNRVEREIDLMKDL